VTTTLVIKGGDSEVKVDDVNKMSSEYGKPKRKFGKSKESKSGGYRKGTKDKGPGNQELKCFRCGKDNHKADDCRFKNLQCYRCQEIGHISLVCPNRESEDSDSEEDTYKRNHPRKPKVDKVGTVYAVEEQYLKPRDQRQGGIRSPREEQCYRCNDQTLQEAQFGSEVELKIKKMLVMLVMLAIRIHNQRWLIRLY